eukprot:4087120-Amphidinium_carterae.1
MQTKSLSCQHLRRRSGSLWFAILCVVVLICTNPLSSSAQVPRIQEAAWCLRIRQLHLAQEDGSAIEEGEKVSLQPGPAALQADLKKAKGRREA